MASMEDVLREKTFKGQTEDLPRRIFYTLDADKALQTHRNSKAIALLVDHLHKKGLISDKEIDELLFQLLG